MAVAKDKDRARNYSFVAFVKDSASQHELERMFRTDSLTDTHIAIGDVNAAIAWLSKAERSPQKLLVDITDSSRPLDELDLLADACDPSVDVYALGDRNDVGLYRNLLSRGVQDYLVKPLNVELVRRSLAMGGSSSVRRGRHGKCVVVMGTRGGVGTTSVAANLARKLVQGGARRRVVYLDLNVFDGCGASTLGQPGGTAFIDLIGNIDRLDQQYVERALSEAGDGLYVLNAELEYAEVFNPTDGALTTLLNVLGQYFHYVVVDTQGRSGPMVNDALAQAGLVCVVSDASVHSARVLTRLVRYVEGRASPPPVMTILNHVRPATSNQVSDKDFEKATELQMQLHIGFDPKGPALAENLAQGLSDSSQFAHSIETLAKLVTGDSVKNHKKSWWRKLIKEK